MRCWRGSADRYDCIGFLLIVRESRLILGTTADKLQIHPDSNLYLIHALPFSTSVYQIGYSVRLQNHALPKYRRIICKPKHYL